MVLEFHVDDTGDREDTLVEMALHVPPNNQDWKEEGEEVAPGGNAAKVRKTCLSGCQEGVEEACTGTQSLHVSTVDSCKLAGQFQHGHIFTASSQEVNGLCRMAALVCLMCRCLFIFFCVIFAQRRMNAQPRCFCNSLGCGA